MWSLATKKQPPKLFRAAITSSTYPGFQYRYNGRIPQNLFNEVAAELGAMRQNLWIVCVRPMARLLGDILNVLLAAFCGTAVFGPVIDGSFITQSPMKALLHGPV
ncbi:hypothetical protein DFH06DRAFT_1238092, partial [Mycena polygramma]